MPCCPFNNLLGLIVLATPSDLKSLDLYGALSSLPKRASDVEVEDPPMSRTVPIGAPELSASIYKAKSRKGKLKETEDGEMGKKEIGRLKGKMKVLDRVKGQEQGRPKEDEKECRTKDLVRRRDEENQDSKEAKRLRVDEGVSGDEMDET